ncbi:hypothetical protein FHS52_001094 [Erythromicrobium ramosum]|uniref:Uncharacterized protein n=1 Tax=Erythrobacter ramosus TaxID=35811 RepID=A0A6I4UDG6_9SPHN|nr:hypothetical protein [Erythrobacter ramosus]MBB3775151.1 hypothetical protein [Erythrobacter ramosus]MXP37221.1 hypothetical protein [Erythrobacter ramosus]
MAEVFLTGHAIQRYRERVADVPLVEIRRALDCRAVRTAIAFGARYVRLGGGQRVLLDENRVVTILPKETHENTLAPGRDHRGHEGEGHAQG